jgi:hypothetical protein
VEAYAQAEELWKENYDLDASEGLEKKLEAIIKRVESKG